MREPIPNQHDMFAFQELRHEVNVLHPPIASHNPQLAWKREFEHFQPHEGGLSTTEFQAFNQVFHRAQETSEQKAIGNLTSLFFLHSNFTRWRFKF
jgi:hypothetical protein